MENEIKKQKFIEYRAEEWSLDRISKQINVSKPTLIKWCREFEVEIHNQKSILLDSIKEEFQITRKNNLKALQSFLVKIESEFVERDFKDLSSDKLFKLYTEIKSQLSDSLEVSYKAKEEFDMQNAFTTIATWSS